MDRLFRQSRIPFQQITDARALAKLAYDQLHWDSGPLYDGLATHHLWIDVYIHSLTIIILGPPLHSVV